MTTNITSFCSNCGAQLNTSFTYCPTCGIKVLNTSPVISSTDSLDNSGCEQQLHKQSWFVRHPWFVYLGIALLGLGIYGILQIDVDMRASNPVSRESTSTPRTATPRPSFELIDISTGWVLTGTGAWTMYVPNFTFTVQNTGSIDIESIVFTGRFYTTSGTIMGSDISQYVYSIPVNESRGSYRLQCTNGYTVPDGTWDSHLEYMQSHTYSPHRVEVFASVNNGSQELVDEYNIYIPN